MYIGSSKNIDYRFYQHKYELRRNKHENSYLQNAFNKYGESNFRFEVVSYCSDGEELYHEQNLVNKFKPVLYNINHVVTKPPSQKGKKQSTLHVSRRAESHRKSNHKMTEENRLKMSKVHKGKKVTNDWKKIRIAQIDMNTGECLQVFNSLMDAGDYVNIDKARKIASNITRCLLGYNESAAGYHWLYWDKITPPFHGQSKKVKLLRRK